MSTAKIHRIVSYLRGRFFRIQSFQRVLLSGSPGEA